MIKKCERCGRMRRVHAKGMCMPCYTSTWKKKS